MRVNLVQESERHLEMTRARQMRVDTRDLAGLKELCQERPTCLEAIKCDEGTEISNCYAEKRQSMSQKIMMLEHIKERAIGSIGIIFQHILNTKKKTMLVCTNDMLDFVFKELQLMFI